MTRYKVELLSIDRKDKSKDIQFFTFVDASDSDDAVSKAEDYPKDTTPGY